MLQEACLTVHKVFRKVLAAQEYLPQDPQEEEVAFSIVREGHSEGREVVSVGINVDKNTGFMPVFMKRF